MWERGRGGERERKRERACTHAALSFSLSLSLPSFPSLPVSSLPFFPFSPFPLSISLLRSRSRSCGQKEWEVACCLASRFLFSPLRTDKPCEWGGGDSGKREERGRQAAKCPPAIQSNPTRSPRPTQAGPRAIRTNHGASFPSPPSPLSLHLFSSFSPTVIAASPSSSYSYSSPALPTPHLRAGAGG